MRRATPTQLNIRTRESPPKILLLARKSVRVRVKAWVRFPVAHKIEKHSKHPKNVQQVVRSKETISQ
jgi:hypothetical protein